MKLPRMHTNRIVSVLIFLAILSFSVILAFRLGARERIIKLPPGEAGDVTRLAVAFEKAPYRQPGTYRAELQAPEINGDFARARVTNRSSRQPDRTIYLKKVDGVWVVIGASTDVKASAEFGQKYGLPAEWYQ